MTTERQACGLGSFLTMSCRDRAEAFARRLQSRLQSLGGNGSRDGASSPADESSWLTRQSDVTSHQPRLSSSSESDIYFDFDLDCESPGSPVEETECSETLPDYMVNKNRAFHCPPKAQYSSESGCVSSPSTVAETSPDSDSSDGLYYDSENVGSDLAICHPNSKHDSNHVYSQETGRKEFIQNEGPTSDDGIFVRMNGHILGLKQESPTSDREGRSVGKRNFRNAAGFRVRSQDKTSRIASETDMQPISISDLGSLPSEGSTADEYCECPSAKQEGSLPGGLRSLNDSGYPNTAESSRCNSQNEGRQTETNDISPPRNEVHRPTQCCDVSNGNAEFSQKPKEIAAGTEVSAVSCLPDIPRIDVCNSSDPQSTACNHDEGKSYPHFPNAHTINCPEHPTDSCLSSLSDALYTSTLTRPSRLTVEYAIDVVALDASVYREHNETTCKKSSEDDDDDDDPDRSTPRVRRCSSLKTGKTPPGTPGRKKIVRFADVLGLDLADVRTFLDEIPKIPRSAYEDLQCSELLDTTVPSLGEGTLSDIIVPSCLSGPAQPDRCLIPLFQQPAGQPYFIDRVREDFVCLENAVVTDRVSFCVSGTVRVRNLDFHKSVHVRYSLDGWKTFADLQATYVPNSCDGFSDKFSFTLYAHTLQVGQRLEFAIRFQCRGGQYWDSNRAANYAFQCLPPADHTSYLPLPMPIAVSPDDHIPSSFY